MPTPNLKDLNPGYFQNMERERIRRAEEQSSPVYQKQTTRILNDLIADKGIIHGVASTQNANQIFYPY